MTIELNEHGEVGTICADEAIELYFVSPHTPHDRVYLFGGVRVGVQHVREQIGGFAVGHAKDGTLTDDEPVSPRLPPSKPTLALVQAGGSATADELAAEIADLRSSVIAFGATAAAVYSAEQGWPANHLHPTHYDILARAGGRMTDFVRHEVEQ